MRADSALFTGQQRLRLCAANVSRAGYAEAARVEDGRFSGKSARR